MTGTSLTNQTFVVVYWRWLAFLLSQIVVSAVFLGIIIIRTRTQNLQVVKSSSLATLAALDEESRMYLGSIDDLSALRDRAKRLHVKLDMSGALGLNMWLATPSEGSLVQGSTDRRSTEQEGKEKDEEGLRTPTSAPPRRWRGRHWR